MFFLLFLLFLLLWLGSRKGETDPSVEQFISLFIVEYAERTGRVLTREEASRLVRTVWELRGGKILQEASRESELLKAKKLTERLCAEAERRARQKD